MTPNQKHAQEEYDRFMPKLMDARAATVALSKATTAEDIVVAFARIGHAVTVFLDEMIVDMEKRHKDTMSRTY